MFYENVWLYICLLNNFSLSHHFSRVRSRYGVATLGRKRKKKLFWFLSNILCKCPQFFRNPPQRSGRDHGAFDYATHQCRPWRTCPRIIPVPKMYFFSSLSFAKKASKPNLFRRLKTGRYLFFFAFGWTKMSAVRCASWWNCGTNRFFFLFTIKEEEKRWNTQICIVEIGSLNLNYNNTVDVFRLHIAIWLQSVSFTTTKSNK